MGSGPISGGRRRRRPLRAAVLALALLGALGGGWYAVHRSMPAWYARLWFPLEYEAAIATEARRFDVEPALVAAVIYEESGFVPDSRSHRGAVGLMQVLPSTARFVASLRPRPSPAPDRLEDPGVNIAYGTSYLHYLMDRYGEIPLALAAYNAGEANVDGWVARAREEGQALRVPDDIPFGETRRYVREVLRTRDIYRRAYGDRLRG